MSLNQIKREDDVNVNTSWDVLRRFRPRRHRRVLTGLVCGVIIFHQEGVAVVPDLLAGLRVVVSDQRLQLRIVDALPDHDVDGRLAIASWYREGFLPHGMHWRRERRRSQLKRKVILNKKTARTSSCSCLLFKKTHNKLKMPTPTFHVVLCCFLHSTAVHFKNKLFNKY